MLRTISLRFKPAGGLCLAHYCETHGPTPLMVTEGLPVECTSCFEDQGLYSRRPSAGSRSRFFNPADNLSSLAKSCSRNSSAGSDKKNVHALRVPSATPAMETPPESPRVAALQGNSFRRDSSFRRTYDDNDKKRASPCENCALTMPKKTKEGATPTMVDNNGPILRTRIPYERVPVPATLKQPSPPRSDSSDCESTTTTSRSPHRRAYSRSKPHATKLSSDAFSSVLHDHYRDYTSTHEPLAPISFSIIRQSCLRTLSCETLPPSTSQPSDSSTSPSTHTFSSTFTSSSSSGGPIFFGDPLAGYTTAYIFRISDPSARGRRRVFALIAHSTHHERAAMQVFSFLSAAFRDLAAWILTLAEIELDRSESPSVSGLSKNSTPMSSFLSGRSRGYEGTRGLVPKSRGLAEIVGLPDFFIELHSRFVRLLIELSMLIGA